MLEVMALPSSWGLGDVVGELGVRSGMSSGLAVDTTKVLLILLATVSFARRIDN